MKRLWGERLTADLGSLAALAQRLQARADSLRDALERRHAVRTGDQYVETDSGWLRPAPIRGAILPDLVQSWMKRAGLWRKMLSTRQYERIASLIGRGSGRVSLPGPALASVRRGAFILCAPGPAPPFGRDYCVQLAVPGVTPIEPLGGRIEAEILSGGVELVAGRPGSKGNGRALRGGRAVRAGSEELLDLEKVALPLFARFPRPGDRMRPMGAPGSRKLQDIFTDLHVPAPLRMRTLIVTMGDRPIWIVGLRIADEIRLTDLTRKALRLRYIPGTGAGPE
jgi:tRNA(Ile)-lysidine synthase